MLNESLTIVIFFEECWKVQLGVIQHLMSLASKVVLRRRDGIVSCLQNVHFARNLVPFVLVAERLCVEGLKQGLLEDKFSLDFFDSRVGGKIDVLVHGGRGDDDLVDELRKANQKMAPDDLGGF
jgi:hypothetical protein